MDPHFFQLLRIEMYIRSTISHDLHFFSAKKISPFSIYDIPSIDMCRMIEPPP